MKINVLASGVSNAEGKVAYIVSRSNTALFQCC